MKEIFKETVDLINNGSHPANKGGREMKVGHLARWDKTAQLLLLQQSYQITPTNGSWGSQDERYATKAQPVQVFTQVPTKAKAQRLALEQVQKWEAECVARFLAECP